MITLFGYGRTTQAIAEKFGNCTIYDDRFSEVSVDRWGNTLKPPRLFDPTKSDLEVTSPGIPPHHPLIRQARHLISEYDLFASDMPYSIWISGTNGKTTTTDMLTHLLAQRGAISGGNIGTPLAQMDPDAPIWVLETSSFTLHYTKKAKPDLYLLLPVSDDHASWHGSFRAYEEAKLKPLRSMQEGEAILLPRRYADRETEGFKIPYDTAEDLADYFGIDRTKLRFRGPFLLDALLALAVTKILFDELDYDRINAYRIGRHRLEEVRDTQGRLWVNDSKATNIDATLAALRTYADRPIHLILGGDDKGADLAPLFKELEAFDVTLYAIGSNAPKLMTLAGHHALTAHRCDTLEHAVERIAAVATPRSVQLLSPAAASLDQFTSYAQRGERFIQLVEDLS